MAITIRPFQAGDAPPIAEITRRCLREVNSRDYPPHIIDRMCAHFTAERYIQLSGSRHIYVAENDGGQVIATVSREGNKIFSMFVDPDMAGQGIGRKLIRHIEVLAARDGYNHMETGASITAHGFYHKLGYRDVRESSTEFGLNYILRKPIPTSGPEGEGNSL